MNIKIKKNTLLLIIVIIGIAIMTIAYVKIGTKRVYSATERYLIEDRGYKKNEISSIEVRHSFLARMLSYDEWGIDVSFKDEPNVEYSYYYRDKKITQVGASGKLDDGINDHEEGPYNENTRIAGRYIKEHGYVIFKLLGEVDRYKLDKRMFQKASENPAYRQIWSVQKVKPDNYFGKEIVVMGFHVRNHPLQKKDTNANSGVRLYVMIVEGKAIGGYSIPIVDTVGGVYSIDGKTPEEVRKLNHQ